MLCAHCSDGSVTGDVNGVIAYRDNYSECCIVCATCMCIYHVDIYAGIGRENVWFCKDFHKLVDNKKGRTSKSNPKNHVQCMLYSAMML